MYCSRLFYYRGSRDPNRRFRVFSPTHGVISFHRYHKNACTSFKKAKLTHSDVIVEYQERSGPEWFWCEIGTDEDTVLDMVAHDIVSKMKHNKHDDDTPLFPYRSVPLLLFGVEQK